MRPLLLSLLALPALAIAQGQLAPPDAPAKTMKTLTQIEPRTPLRTGSSGVEQDPNGGVRITSGGSYYLDGNIGVGTGNAITVLADNVTIDLNGFTLASTASPADGVGVFIDGTANTTIRNGCINGAFEFGITSSRTAKGVVVEDVSLSNIGTGGIYLNDTPNSVVRRCTVSVAGNFGIAAGTVFDSLAAECSSVGIYSSGLAQNCSAGGETYYGLQAQTALNCIGLSKGGTGLWAAIATGCKGESTSDIGLQATLSATNCSGTTTTGSFGLNISSNSSTPIAGTAENCRGSVTGNGATGTGLFAGAATNCKGTSASGLGLLATTATNCIGTSKAGIGLQTTQTATGCSGTTTSGGFGLKVATLAIAPVTPVAGTAENCTGSTTGAGTGLSAGAATNCMGTSLSGLGLVATTANTCIGASTSGMGLQADTASNCTGTSTSGERGLYIIGTASYCRGKRPGGIALSATTAIGCTAEAGDFLVINQYLMP